MQRLVLSSLVNDHIFSTFLHLLLDEAKEVFLVHARGSVDVSIHLVKWGRGEESGGGREGRARKRQGREEGGERRGRRREGREQWSGEGRSRQRRERGEEGSRGRQREKRKMEEELHTTRYQL